MPSNGNVGASTSSNGSANIHFQPNNHAPSVGVGISNTGTPSMFVNNQVAMTFENKPVDYAAIAKDSKIYVPSSATNHVVTQMPGVNLNIATENQIYPEGNKDNFKSNQQVPMQPLNVTQLDGGISFNSNVQQQKQANSSAFKQEPKRSSEPTASSKTFYHTSQPSQPAQKSLLGKALDTIANVAVTALTGSSAAHANPVVIPGSVAGSAVVPPGAISAKDLPGKPPKFTWGQLGKELHDIANTIVSSLMLANHMLALNLYQPLTTQIHEANKEDLLLPGGSNVKIDSSTPPSMAQDIDSKLHKHSDAGATRPKPEDLYIPGYTAYDGDPVLFMFKAPPRRIECANGLIYEDAPYHAVTDNELKSRRPTDPKYVIENSLGIKETSSTRISYDKYNNEIAILMEHEKNIFHGHVREWSVLMQDQKNILINRFNFNVKGMPPKHGRT